MTNLYLENLRPMTINTNNGQSPHNTLPLLTVKALCAGMGGVYDV
jgi:hypothetical protein